MRDASRTSGVRERCARGRECDREGDETLTTGSSGASERTWSPYPAKTDGEGGIMAWRLAVEGEPLLNAVKLTAIENAGKFWA